MGRFLCASARLSYVTGLADGTTQRCAEGACGENTGGWNDDVAP